MFKVATVHIDTSPESLPESKDGFVDWLLRQISPDDFQHRLEFRLVSGLGLVDPVPFQHYPQDVIVKRVEIGRVICVKNTHLAFFGSFSAVSCISFAVHLHYSNFL